MEIILIKAKFINRSNEKLATGKPNISPLKKFTVNKDWVSSIMILKKIKKIYTFNFLVNNNKVYFLIAPLKLYYIDNLISITLTSNKCHYLRLLYTKNSNNFFSSEY